MEPEGLGATMVGGSACAVEGSCARATLEAMDHDRNSARVDARQVWIGVRWGRGKSVGSEAHKLTLTARESQSGHVSSRGSRAALEFGGDVHTLRSRLSIDEAA